MKIRGSSYTDRQGPREDQKSRGSETSNLPKNYHSNKKKLLLLHFYITILKSQRGQLTPLTFRNAIKTDFLDLRGKFLEDLRSLTPLTFGPREVPVLG